MAQAALVFKPVWRIIGAAQPLWRHAPTSEAVPRQRLQSRPGPAARRTPHGPGARGRQGFVPIGQARHRPRQRRTPAQPARAEPGASRSDGWRADAGKLGGATRQGSLICGHDTDVMRPMTCPPRSGEGQAAQQPGWGSAGRSETWRLDPHCPTRLAVASCPSPKRGGKDARACYFTILATTPEPTVRPPSRMVKRRPWSMAIGVISSMSSSALSPGMIISTPSFSFTIPVTSVVRK